MDYIERPRSLIYKERTNLKDFGVHIPGTINNQLFSKLKKYYLATDRAKELILRCFNNAYYICTLIPFEDFPDMIVDKYEELLMKGDPYRREEVCAISMAMVSKLLPAYDERWRQEDNGLIVAIHHRFTHFQWMNSGAHKGFEYMVKECNTDGFFLPSNEFAPRDIVEVIENDDIVVLIRNAEYICERLVLVDDPKKRTYGADLALARLNDELRDTYECYGYDPKTKTFKPAEPGPLGPEPDFEDDLWKEADPVKKAIKYYKTHYPPKTEIKKEKASPKETIDPTAQINQLAAENIRLRQQSELQAQEINELRTEKSDLKNKLSETQQQVEELKQKLAQGNDVGSNQSGFCDKSYIESLNKQLAEVKNENDILKEKNNLLEKQLQPDEEVSEEQKMGIDERIVLFSTVLGVTLSKEDTSQTQLAKAIANFSGDEWRSIRSRIVNINQELAQERETPGNGLAPHTLEAVKNVKEWIKKIGRAGIAPVAQKLITEIDDIYLNKKE